MIFPEERGSELRIIKNRHYGNIECILAFLVSGLLSFVYLFRSPLHPWIGADSGTDASVFKTVAMMMDKGYMPYRDSFDHKGPILYILNWIGNRISGYRGVWVVEFVFLAATVFLIYKTARLTCRIGSSCVVTLLSLHLLFRFFQGGDLTEEYAMPLITAGLYIFLDYLLNNRLLRKRIWISGACMGATLLLRPNMVTVWAVFCIAIFIFCIKDNEWALTGKFVLWFLMGVAVIVLPILVWLGVHDDMYWFWDAYIAFNRLMVTLDGRSPFHAKWTSFVTFFGYQVVMFSIMSMAWYAVRKRCRVNTVYMIYLIASLWMICLSGMTYWHYGMVLVPAVAYPLSLIFADIAGIKDRQISGIVTLLVSLYALSVLVLPDWNDVTKDIARVYHERNEEHLSDTVVEVTGIIRSITEENDPISVYGNWDLIYLTADRRHATRFSYQYPIGEVRPQFMEDYKKQLVEEGLPVVVVQQKRYDENIRSFLDEHEYRLLWTETGDMDGALIFVHDQIDEVEG